MPPRKDESRQALPVVLDQNGDPAYIDATRVVGTDRAQLNVSAVIVPSPPGMNDFYTDDTITPIPAPPAVLIIPIIDPTFGAFTSRSIILENLSGNTIFFSFDNIQFHRLMSGRTISMDNKGATSLFLLGTVGGEAFNFHAWG